MKRFDPETYYRSSDEALRLIATAGTLAVWRHEDRGPTYTKIGNRVLYRGTDLNAFLDKRSHAPRNGPAKPRKRAGEAARPAA